MKPWYLFLFIFSCISCSNPGNKTDSQPPNIIFILADDLGYGELGCYGQQKIETPNIDKLAKSGMKFSQHYSGAPVCAPARCVLLTGKHSGHSYIRGNDEWETRGDVWNYYAMLSDSTLEGQSPLPSKTNTIAKVLKKAGYTTGMVGKWGLGAPQTESIPTKMGFDYFIGYNCQRQAHTYFPVHLYLNDSRLYLDNDTVAPNTKLSKESNPENEDSYSNFTLTDYAPDIMFDGMINFVEENKDNPFFLYWATPLPHVPIQAPKKWIDHYRLKFGDEKPYLGEKGYFPQQFPKAGYAAMISYLDERVGQLIQILKDNNIYEKTIIIFTSDNGPTYAGGVDPEFFNSAGPFNNNYGWTKGFVNEGGLRVPFIISWPFRIEENMQTNHISAFHDLMPTLCDIANIEIPQNIDGVSFLPTVLNNGLQTKHEYLYWEFPEYGGQQAVRLGNWKAIRKNIRDGNLDIELYDLNVDIKEDNNIASKHPDIISKVKEIMELEHETPEIDKFKLSNLGD